MRKKKTSEVATSGVSAYKNRHGFDLFLHFLKFYFTKLFV